MPISHDNPLWTILESLYETGTAPQDIDFEAVQMYADYCDGIIEPSEDKDATAEELDTEL